MAIVVACLGLIQFAPWCQFTTMLKVNRRVDLEIIVDNTSLKKEENVKASVALQKEAEKLESMLTCSYGA